MGTVMSDELLSKVAGYVSHARRDQLEKIVQEKKVPLSRLIAIAIERELESEKPFEFDVSLPDDEFVDFAFADEAGKILDYMGKIAGLSLDLMVLARHDMGVPDRQTFMYAVRECIAKELLVPFKPRQPRFVKFQYEDVIHYRIKGAEKPEKKKIRKEASEYQKFKRLEKKYKDK